MGSGIKGWLNAADPAAQIEELERLMSNAIRLVFNSGPALSRLIGEDLVSVGPTDDFRGVKFVSANVTFIVDPRSEVITVVDAGGNVPNGQYHAKGGILDSEQQEQLLGRVARIRHYSSTGSDPVQQVASLGGAVVEPAAA